MAETPQGEGSADYESCDRLKRLREMRSNCTLKKEIRCPPQLRRITLLLFIRHDCLFRQPVADWRSILWRLFHAQRQCLKDFDLTPPSTNRASLGGTRQCGTLRSRSGILVSTKCASRGHKRRIPRQGHSMLAASAQHHHVQEPQIVSNLAIFSSLME